MENNQENRMEEDTMATSNKTFKSRICFKE